MDKGPKWKEFSYKTWMCRELKDIIIEGYGQYQEHVQMKWVMTLKRTLKVDPSVACAPGIKTLLWLTVVSTKMKYSGHDKV